MGKLDGRIALITGGSDGIGLAIAQEFVAEGAYVFITGRRQEVLDAAVKKIGHEHVTSIQGDVAKLDDLDHVMKVIEKQKGKIQILVANAAISNVAPIGSITEKSFDDLFNVNVKGVLFTVQKALPILDDGSSIILIGSNMSIMGLPASSVYSATKAAIRSFARCWCVDLKDRRIRVNTLSPGPILTAMLQNVGDTKEESEQFLDFIISSSLMGRIGQPVEIAKVALFLASDDSSYITGIELFADGGHSQI